METAEEDDEVQRIRLDKAVGFALEEGRMILPGIQTLFGFQLVAVFNERFAQVFEEPGQLLHLTALVLVAISCALAMTPAAIHRQGHRSKVSKRLLHESSFFIGAAMTPLLFAISIDVGLVAYAITDSARVGTGLGAACAAVFIVLWIIVPLVHKRRS